MINTPDLSFIGLTIQVIGVASIAVLFQLLHRILPRAYFMLWSKAWTVMVVALLALRMSFVHPSLRWPLESAYYLGEYAFAWLLASGFNQYPDRPRDPIPTLKWPWLMALVWAVTLALLPVSFSMRFGAHALVFSSLLARALWRLHAIQLPALHRWAHWLALFSLMLLTVNFLANGVAQPTHWFDSTEFSAGYAAYQSIIDLFVEVLVAFGLVAIAAVDMRSTLERAHTMMQGERDRMSMLAYQDGLTGCYNRLALNELKSRIDARWGSVTVIDLNYLKSLNDVHGHAMGDLAICQVANALKSALRPSDHVFRTGGDEFILVTFGLTKDVALQRVAQTQTILQTVALQPGQSEALSIAFGAAEFHGHGEFDAAVDAADAAMYAHKQSGRKLPQR